MSFFKCQKCDHVDTHERFTSRAGRHDLPPICPRCFNDRHNIIELGDDISCSGCIYNTLIAGCCSHPANKTDANFWNLPQSSCFTSGSPSHSSSGAVEQSRQPVVKKQKAY